MNKLPISVGILAWNSGQTLVDTLFTYYKNGFFDIVDDSVILFQEFSDDDRKIAEHFGIQYIPMEENIGIGKAFIHLAQQAKNENILLLEHDWHLIENKETTYDRLKTGLKLLYDEISCVKYRHRLEPGHPLFSLRHKDNELTYYDPEIECTSPHLLDCVHWVEHPDKKFPEHISKFNDYYITTSRYGNWTNNPCMYKTKFYYDTVSEFAGTGIQLEGNISKWWAKQSFKVAHGEGLFKHVDLKKYRQ